MPRWTFLLDFKNPGVGCLLQHYIKFWKLDPLWLFQNVLRGEILPYIWSKRKRRCATEWGMVFRVLPFKKYIICLLCCHYNKFYFRSIENRKLKWKVITIRRRKKPENSETCCDPETLDFILNWDQESTVPFVSLIFLASCSSCTLQVMYNKTCAIVFEN